MYYNKRKMLVSLIWVIIGITLIILDIIGVIDNPIYSGMGGGLLVVGAMQIYRNLKYHNNEEYKELLLFNLKEYIVNKLSMLKAFNTKKHMDFIDNLSINANRLLDVIEGINLWR